MHISGHCLSKTFIFPYLNMLMFAPLSFEATWHPLHPTAAKSGFLSVCLLLSLVGGGKKEKRKQKHVNWPPVSSHQAFCVTNKSALQYLLFQGIIRFYRDYPACSNTPPWESSTLTHTHAEPHTGPPSIKPAPVPGRVSLRRAAHGCWKTSPINCWPH